MSVKQIAGNAGMLAASSLVLRLFGIIVIGMTTRMLGVYEFGIFNTHIVAVTILATIAFAGLSPFIIRETSARGNNPDLTHLRWGLIFVLVLGPLLSLVGFMTYRFQVGSSAESLTLFALVAVIPLQNFILSLFQGLNKFGKVLASNSLSATSLFLLVGIAYSVKAEAKWFYYAYLGANVLGLLITLFLASSELVRIFKSPSSAEWSPLSKEEYKNYASLFTSATFGILHNKLDILLLNFMMGATIVGMYSASYRIMEYLLYVPSIISSALLPVFAANTHSVAATSKLILRLQAAFMLIIVIFLLTLNKVVFKTLYGADFQANLGYWILFYGVFSFIFTSIYGQVLYSSGGYRPFLKIGALSLLANLLLNLLLIQRYGATGCALATAGSFMVSALAHTWYVKQVLVNEPLFRTFFWGNFWFAAVVTACLMQTPILIVIAIYCILGWISGMLDPTDIHHSIRLVKSNLMRK